MSRQSKSPRVSAPVAPEAVEPETLVAPAPEAVEPEAVEPDAEAPTFADLLEDGVIDETVAEDVAKPNSVVKAKYKKRYAERAAANGQKGKVAQRSCWDWLAQCMAELVLDKGKLNEAKLRELLDLNGVDHSRWQNRSKGWEGRLRMTGRLALQRVVAECGELKTTDDVLVAPADWVAKFQH